jgi:hypothetical protein
MDSKDINRLFATIDKGTDDGFYIHFESNALCDAFKQWYTKAIGHTCCSGKGCKLLNVTSWSEIRQLKQEYESVSGKSV